MSSGDPKKSKPKGAFHLNIETSFHQAPKKVPKNEEKSQKPSTKNEFHLTESSSNQSQSTEEINLTTKGLIPPAQPENPYTSQKKNKIYTYNQEYFDELYLNLILDEVNFYQKIKPNYMNIQRNINYEMRAILVDWLIDIHYKLNMKKKTLFLCIFILDAFLSKINISMYDLQLLGVTAFLIACKHNEVEYPPLKALIKISNDSFTIEDLKDMEQIVMKKLDFDILAPTCDEFFAINAENFEFTEKQKFFGEYFLDISLIDYHLLKYKQSTIAVACGYLVIKYFNLDGKDLILSNTSPEVKHDEVKDCARHLLFLVKYLSNNSLVAIKNKYMSDKYLKVAELCEEN